MAQPASATVLLFSEEGDRIGTLGGPGEEPGALRGIAMLGWRGDSVWVADPVLFRVTLFPMDGGVPLIHLLENLREPAHRRSIPVPAEGNGWLTIQDVGGSRENPQIIQEMVAFSDREAAPTHLVDLGPRRERVSLRGPGAGSVTMEAQPFSAHTLFAISPLGTGVTLVRRARVDALPEPTTYTVTRISLEGDTTLHVVRPFDARPISEGTRQRVIEYYLRVPGVRRMFPDLDEARTRLRAAVHIPDTHPPVTELAVGRDESIWLRGPDRWDETVCWEVLTSGRMRTVELDRDLRLVTPVEDGLWALSLNEDQTAGYLVRFRLEPASGSGRC